MLSFISVVALDPKNVSTGQTAHQEIHPAAGVILSHLIFLVSTFNEPFQTKMAKLEAGDKSSNSLLANVLDMDDDFLLAGGLRFVGQ